MCLPRFARPAVSDCEVDGSLLITRALCRECPYRGDQYRRRRGDAGGGHDEVEVLLRTEVRAEPGLVDDEVRQLQGHALRDDAARAVRDVGERAGVHQRRRVLGRLHEVRHDRLVEQHHHRAGRLQVRGAHHLAVEAVADDDVRQALAQILPRRREREDGHHLARRRDDETRLARQPVQLAAEPDDHVPERAIVHVQRAGPEDVVDVDAQLVAVVDVRVEHRGEQVVRGADRVDVAVEVKVDLLGRQHLREAAAGGPALEAEHRPERRLPQRRDGLAPDPREALGKANRGHRLPLAVTGRRDGGDENQFAPGLPRASRPVEQFEAELGGVLPVPIRGPGQECRVRRRCSGWASASAAW